LTGGAIGTFSTRTPEEVVAFLDSIKPLFDVDGNGSAEALTDGLILLRYLFGLRGSVLTAGAIGAGATRDTAEIESYVGSLTP
jgi:hypothetical protein